MVRTWYMRYEAKHSSFKRIAGYMGNFTNVALTLAKRYQNQTCYNMNTGTQNVEGAKNQFLLRQPTIGCGKQVVAGDNEFYNVLKEKETTLAITDILYMSKKVKVHGTEYRVGSIVYTGQSNDLPEFASIQAIFVLASQNIYFILEMFLTTTFASHFHSYEVQRPADAEIVALQ